MLHTHQLPDLIAHGPALVHQFLRGLLQNISLTIEGSKLRHDSRVEESQVYVSKGVVGYIQMLEQGYVNSSKRKLT
jgi:hypothetical protein